MPLWDSLRIPPSGNTLSEFADQITDEFAEDFAQLETGLKAYINFLCLFYTVIQERGQLRLSKPEEVGER